MSNDYKDKIIKELSKTVKILGGTYGILSIMGSYGDTLDDKEFLEELKGWNKG